MTTHSTYLRKIFTAGFVALMLLATACGSSAEIGEATSSSGDTDDQSDTNDQTVPAAPTSAPTPTPAPAPAPHGFDPSGTWDTNYSPLELTVSGSDFSGLYDGKRVEGTVGDGVLEGIFLDGVTTCADERQGSVKWGLFEFTFSEDRTTFDGEWSDCGKPFDSAWNGTQTSGPALEPQPIGTGLPATTDYAYLDVTLLDVGVTPRPAADLGASEIDDDEQAIVLSININNDNEQTTWSIPHAALFWVDIDGELFEPISSGTIEVEPSKDEDAVIVVAVPDDADLTNVTLWLQESARDADLRTRPAFIAADGTTDGGFEAIELLNLTDATIDWGCSGSYGLTKVVLDDEPGYKENGAPVWNPRDGLGRPLDGELFATTFGQATKAPASCQLSIQRLDPNVNVDGIPRDPVSSSAVRINGWTDAPTDDIWTFNVPEDARQVEIYIPQWEATILAMG